MTIEDFINTVEEMRSAQKRYFRERNYADLTLSKNLERKVDQFLAERSRLLDDNQDGFLTGFLNEMPGTDFEKQRTSKK